MTHESINYVKYGGAVCVVLGGILQYFRSYGVEAKWIALIGGLLAVAAYLVTCPYAGDWRLYLGEGALVIPGYAGAIMGGASWTSKGAGAIVASGNTPEDRAKLAASPLVPVTPSKEAP